MKLLTVSSKAFIALMMITSLSACVTIVETECLIEPIRTSKDDVLTRDTVEQIVIQHKIHEQLCK